jgi:hypothetical protein
MPTTIGQKHGEGRPANRTAFAEDVQARDRVRDQALRRRRVYQIAPAPAATISPPSEMTAPIGAPVTGSALPALTPPPCVVVPGPGVGLAPGPAELGLTPPGGTVSVWPVGVGLPAVDVPGPGVVGFVRGVVVGVVLGPVLP